jgi:ATP-GRASP peptide maturase of grasp-with-spasm system
MGEHVIRLNADDDKHKLESINQEGIFFKNTLTNEVINVKKAKAVWWRRRGLSQKSLLRGDRRKTLFVGGMDLSPLIDGTIADIFKLETNTLIEYIYNEVYVGTAINLGRPIFSINRLKVLEMAKEIGLQVPKYEIIVHGHQLEETKKSLGKVVSKPIADGIYDIVENKRFYTYTELIEDPLYQDNLNTNFFPSLVCELVEKAFEIRTFYLDGQFYSMAIFSQSDPETMIDFRKYTNNRREPYKLPGNIETKIKKLFTEINLNCGSVDMIVDRQGNYVFLEVNPVGQFDMTSRPCNYNLHKKVAEYLSYGKN